jgi:hypothetical protein
MGNWIEFRKIKLKDNIKNRQISFKLNEKGMKTENI